MFNSNMSSIIFIIFIFIIFEKGNKIVNNNSKGDEGL